jgi:hypothetical protein
MMRNIKTVLLACAVGLSMVSWPGSLKASTEPVDQITYMTFGQAVVLPGVILPPGEYIFRLPARDTSRMVLQVLSLDRDEVYGMFHTIPTSREEITNDPAVTLHESARGTPMPLRNWFYAGQRLGMEFAYSKSEAEQIAQHSTHPVLTTELTYVE